jgi:ABC-type spermidine/putrescine transport system permease subunit I
MQTKRSMMIETLLNTFSGFVVSYAITSMLLPYMETLGAMAITWIFTIVSLIRSYVWRMIFNKKIAKKAVDIAAETC